MPLGDVTVFSLKDSYSNKAWCVEYGTGSPISLYFG
jgi:hypothetical protein